VNAIAGFGSYTNQLTAEVLLLCNQLSQTLGRPISPGGHLVGGLGEVFDNGLKKETLQGG